MTYNEFIESESELKNALDNLFRLDCGTDSGNKLELTSVKVIPPTLSYNECMILQEEYVYNVIITCTFVEGIDKGDTFTTTIKVPKMCERGFLVKNQGSNILRWRSPVNYGDVYQLIYSRKSGVNLRIGINWKYEIFPFKRGKETPCLTILGDNKSKTMIDLYHYLTSSGVKDVDKILQKPTITPKNYISDIPELPIPKEISERLANKYLQLTGENANFDVDKPTITPLMIYNLTKVAKSNPIAFEYFSLADITFYTFQQSLFKRDLYKTDRRIKYKIAHDLSVADKSKRKISGDYINNIINRTFNMLGQEHSVQSGALSNAVSFISQTNKVYFRKSGEKKLLHYTDDFYGVVCPAKTPEGVGLCGIKNELSSAVTLKDDGPYITVMEKNPDNLSKYKIKELKYFEYYKSKVLLHDFYDYENNKLVPVNGKVKVIYKGKFVQVEGKLDAFDYIQVSPEATLSYGAGLIPFMSHCDATRLSMATNMQDQAIPIIGGRRSVITTKIADSLYNKTDLNWKADFDGVIEEIYDGYIKVKKTNGEVKIIPTPKSIESSAHTYNLFRPAVKVGQKVKKGDVLMECNSFKNGHLALTVPLRVAFTNYSSKSDEDAFVISDRAAELLGHPIIHEMEIDIPHDCGFLFDKKYLVEAAKRYPNILSEESLEPLNEFGLPIVGRTYKQNELIAAILQGPTAGTASKSVADLIKKKDVGERIMYRPVLHHIPYEFSEGKVLSVKLYYRKSLNNSSDLVPLIKYYDDIESERVKEFKHKLGDYKIPEYQITLRDGKRSIDPDVKIVIKIETINKVKIGDKIANRYGGKGTISDILPIDEMPHIGGFHGTPIDICVPPKSVINRKNYAQIIECNLADLSGICWQKNSEYLKNKEFDKVRESLNKLYITDKFSNYSDEELVKYHNEFDTYYTIEVGAIDVSYTNERMIELNKFFGRSMKGDDLYRPKFNDKVRVPVTTGIIEFERLHFLPEHKAKATSNIEYADKLIMGIGSGRSEGQRLGQMEVWALVSYNVLPEFKRLANVSGAIDTDKSFEYSINSTSSVIRLIGLHLKKN